MKHKISSRLLALLLCFALLLPNFSSLAVFAQSTAALQNGLGQPATTTAKPLAVVLAGSDVQYSNATYNGVTYADRYAANGALIKDILNRMKKDYPTIDGAFLLGDYEISLVGDHTASSSGLAASYAALNEVYGLTDNIMTGNGAANQIQFVQGNHDPADTTGLDATGAYKFDHYEVYQINHDDFPWSNKESVVQATAAGLKSYLEGKVAEGYTKPIFVITHVPLHHSFRGDNRYASYLADILNEAGKDLNIIFMFGHNHSGHYDDYIGGTNICLTPGQEMLVTDLEKLAAGTSALESYKSMTLNFTYMNAGYLGYSGGTLTSTVFEIYEDRVEMARYSKNGPCNLKNEGVSYKPEDKEKIDGSWDADTTVLESPYVLNLSDISLSVVSSTLGEVLPFGSTAQMQIGVTSETPYTVSWEAMNPDVVSLTPDAGDATKVTVTGVGYGTTTIKATVKSTTDTTTAPAALYFDVAVVQDDAVKFNGGKKTVLYKLVTDWSTLTTGKNYMILNTDDVGAAYALAGPTPNSDSRNEDASVYMTSAKVFQIPGDQNIYTTPVNNYDIWQFYDNADGTARYLGHISDSTSFLAANRLIDSALSYAQPCGFRFCSGSTSDGVAYWTIDAENQMLDLHSYYESGEKVTLTPASPYTLNYNATGKTYQLRPEDDATGSNLYIYEETNATVPEMWMWPTGLSGEVKMNGSNVTGAAVAIMLDNQVTNVPITTDMLVGAYSEIPGDRTCELYCYGQLLTDEFKISVTSEDGVVIKPVTLVENQGNLYKYRRADLNGATFVTVNRNTAGSGQAMTVQLVDGEYVLVPKTVNVFAIEGIDELFVQAEDDSWLWDQESSSGSHFIKSRANGKYLQVSGTNLVFQDTPGSAWRTNTTHYTLTEINSKYVIEQRGDSYVAAARVNDSGGVGYIYVPETELDRVLVYMTDCAGSIEAGAGGALTTGETISKGTYYLDGTSVTEEIPVTIDMLDISPVNLVVPGEYKCKVTYSGVVVCEEFVLTVTSSAEKPPAADPVIISDNNGDIFKLTTDMKTDGNYVFINSNAAGEVKAFAVTKVDGKYEVKVADIRTFDVGENVFVVVRDQDLIWKTATTAKNLSLYNEANNAYVFMETTGNELVFSNQAGTYGWRSNSNGFLCTNDDIYAALAWTGQTFIGYPRNSMAGSGNKYTYIYQQDEMVDTQLAYVDAITGSCAAGSPLTTEAGGNVVIKTLLTDGTVGTQIVPITLGMLEGLAPLDLFVADTYTCSVVYGSKLVVDVAVKTRDGFWGGNNIPTNGADTGLYSKDEVIQKFPQPEANMPITPTISADDVTIYYGGDVSESDLGITVEINGVEVTINPDGTFSPKESWMSEFATLTWADPSMNPADSNDPTKNTQKNTHAYTVVLNPIYDGDSNRTDSSGSVGGDAVEQDQVKATDTGTVNILVPVLSFQDSTIEYGTTPDQNYYDDNDKVISEGSSTKNPGVTWVLIDTNTAPDDTVTVTGTEPELTITYTPVGNTAGDPSKNFKVDTKIDVNVTSSNTDGNIMDVIIFQWTECEHSFDGEEGTHDIGTHVGTADSHEFWIHVGTYGVEDMIIIDFGLDVNINVMTNDHILSSGTTTLIGLASTANGAYGPTFIGKYGVATIVDGKVTYVLNKKGNADVGTLSGMEMSEKESFYYVLAYTLDGEVKYYYAPIHVIPATIIYYEDNFIDYSVSTKNEVIRIPVIVRVPDNWTDPALYAWDENGAPIQNWPGIAMQRVEGEDNWFYGYITPDQMHFIVNYKVNDQTTYQTVNLDVDHNRSALGVWAVLANGANGYGQWEATVGYAQGEAPAAPEYKDAHYTIHVQIPDGWSNASVWAWDFTSAFPAWPGRPLVSEGNGWYTADIPVFAKKFLIAGNDGAVQTIDYVEGNGTEQWIVVDSNVVDGNKLGLTVSTTAPEGYKAPPAYTITPGGWTQDGVTATGPQQEDRPGEGLNDIDASKIYGYDNAYTSMSQHSYGSAMKVNVKNGKYATAKFSFRGTGFDMISLTSCTTGTIIVKVTDKDGNYVVNYMVDTYYGYVFADTDDDGVADSWIVNTDAEDALYQVPVIKVDLNGVKKADDTCYGYGYYNVEIVISYAPLFDHGQCRCEENCDGCYDFYLDAIRIYDPADNGANDSVIKDAYISDDEYKPTYEELRNQLIGVDEFNSLGDKDSTIGVVFIDGNSSLSNSEGGANGGSKPIAGKSPAVTEYANYGPNNELYLAPDQAVAFNLNTVANLKSVHLALKSVGGSATISVYGVDADGTITHALQNEIIETATDLYYSIKSLVGKTVVIRNTGESGILSITNLKTTYTGTLSGQSRQVMSVSQSGVALALASMDETDPAPVEPSTGAIVPGNATLVLKDQVQVNIYFAVNGLSAAPADMGLIIFSGENADGTIENANAVIPGAVYDADTGLYMVHTNGIAAKNLGDEIWFRIYVKQADGTYAYSKLLSYSPKAYAESILSGEFDTGLKALVVAMLNYGAAAQEFFGYKTDALVNAELTAEQQSLVAPYSADMIADVKSVDSNKVGAFIANGGYSAKYPSVICGGTLAINYTFVPSNKVDGEVKFYYWNEAAYNNAEVLTAENATGVLTMVDNRAVVDGIAAKDLDSTIYVAAVYESEGVSYCTGVLAYSVGAYCVSQANGSDAAVSQIVESTAVYGSYAKAFFKG